VNFKISIWNDWNYRPEIDDQLFCDFIVQNCTKHLYVTLFFVAAMLQQRTVLTAIRIFCKNIANTFRRIYTCALFCNFFAEEFCRVFCAKSCKSIYTYQYFTILQQYCKSISSTFCLQYGTDSSQAMMGTLKKTLASLIINPLTLLPSFLNFASANSLNFIKLNGS